MYKCSSIVKYMYIILLPFLIRNTLEMTYSFTLFIVDISKTFKNSNITERLMRPNFHQNLQQISLTSVSPASSFLRATFGKILVLIPQIASPVGHEVSEDHSPESYHFPLSN